MILMRFLDLLPGPECRRTTVIAQSDSFRPARARQAAQVARGPGEPYSSWNLKYYRNLCNIYLKCQWRWQRMSGRGQPGPAATGRRDPARRRAAKLQPFKEKSILLHEYSCHSDREPVIVSVTVAGMCRCSKSDSSWRIAILF